MSFLGKISKMNDCNGTRTNNNLVRKGTFNHLGNYRLWIHSETSSLRNKNVQSKMKPIDCHLVSKTVQSG